uniref:Long-chain-fatty-acid--CoA ligase n=1 Tax=Sinocyclocheilus rhinocerous TaxID=307959 RepID=A0A673KX21_9TELE
MGAGDGFRAPAAVISAGLLSVLGLSWFWSLLALLGVYLCSGGWRFLYVAACTIKRDLVGLCILLRVKFFMHHYIRMRSTVPSIFAQRVALHPDKAALVEESTGEVWSFSELDRRSNAVAQWAVAQGWRSGDVVAVFMESRPLMVALWLGLAKVGVEPALINFNLRRDSLMHCMGVSGARGMVFGAELLDAVLEVKESLSSLSLFCTGSSPVESLDSLSAQNLDDLLFYIYTSGTTGLPKAAIIVHSRYYRIASFGYYSFGLGPDDVVYCCLPLYHSAGNIVGVGQCVLHGLTVVIRRKFSASRFWDDCVKYNCTVVQYIGEICRYLLSQPVRPSESCHQVRVAMGNGLRPNVWEDFMKRFNIKRIGEFYGATECNCSLANMDNKVGACGFNSVILPSVYPIRLLRADEDSMELIRDSRGLCVPCKPGEPGIIVGRINPHDPLRRFDGYANQIQHRLNNLQIMIQRCQRMCLKMFKDIKVCVCEAVGCHCSCTLSYSSGVEGKAGMAAIVDVMNDFNCETFLRDVQNALPSYARPVFLRLSPEVDKTGTFKIQKTRLQKEGFDPRQTSDRLYFLHSRLARYESLTEELYSAIMQGKLSL